MSFAPPRLAFRGAGAVHLSRVDGILVLLHEGRDGTHVTVGESETSFSRSWLLLPRQTAHDRHGHVTPHLFASPEAGRIALYVGLASGEDSNRNRIGMAVLQPRRLGS